MAALYYRDYYKWEMLCQSCYDAIVEELDCEQLHENDYWRDSSAKCDRCDNPAKIQASVPIMEKFAKDAEINA